MDDILQKTVDGKYEIKSDIAIARDGGTISFVVVDDAGESHILFVDRRIGTDTKDVFYKDEYPGKDGSIQLGKNDALIAKVEAAFDAESAKH